MKVFALRSFSYSRDGVTAIEAAAGAESDIPDEMVDALVREGYIRPPSVDAAALFDAPAASRETMAFSGAPENKAPPRKRRAQVEE